MTQSRTCAPPTHTHTRTPENLPSRRGEWQAYKSAADSTKENKDSETGEAYLAGEDITCYVRRQRLDGWKMSCQGEQVSG